MRISRSCDAEWHTHTEIYWIHSVSSVKRNERVYQICTILIQCRSESMFRKYVISATTTNSSHIRKTWTVARRSSRCLYPSRSGDRDVIRTWSRALDLSYCSCDDLILRWFFLPCELPLPSEFFLSTSRYRGRSRWLTRIWSALGLWISMLRLLTWCCIKLRRWTMSWS